MNVNERNFFCSRELNNGMLFEPLFLTAFHSTGIEPELWIAVGVRLGMVGGRYHVTVWSRFYAVFLTLIRNVTEEAKFSAHPHICLCERYCKQKEQW
jgi:hypothetical protein